MLFGNGLQKAEDYIVGAFGWRGRRMYSVRDSYLAGNGECLGNVCSNSSGGMSGKRCNPDCRKGRERRRGNAAGIRVAAGVESMRFNFVHGGLLIGVVAGCGMGIGVLHQNSRLPFAPFLFAATVITQLLQT